MSYQQKLFTMLQTTRSCANCNKTIMKSLPSIVLATTRHFNTTSFHHKKTPATIGVMSWVRSAARRKYLEQKTKDYVKSEDDILKEEWLGRTTPEIEFRTTSRIGDQLDEETMFSHLVKPTVFLSKDKQTIICYHPPPKQIPEEFTKRAVGRSLFSLNEDILNTFKNTMTDKEIEEAKTLRETDPRLWNSNALAKLFEVKPEIINSMAPMNRSQASRANAEKEVYNGMSVMKRKDFRELQKFDCREGVIKTTAIETSQLIYYERLRYIRETRGRDSALRYDSMDGQKKPKEYVPPRL